MTSLVRSLVICALVVSSSSFARAQQVAIVDCTWGYSGAVQMGVLYLSLSAASGLSFADKPLRELECAEVAAELLTAGYERVSAHHGNLGVPAYTFVGAAPFSRSSSAADGFVFVGCRQSSSDYRVRFASSSPGSPDVPRDGASSCAAALAALMKAGFRLVHAGQGVSGGAILYSLHRGRRAPIFEAASFATGPTVMLTTLRCQRTWNGDEFVVSFAEASFGGPAIGSGGDVGCATEMARLLELGYRAVDLSIRADSDAIQLTLAHDGEPIPAPSVKKRAKPRNFDFVALQCDEICQPGDDFLVAAASTSSRVTRMSRGEKCQPALARLVSSGFEVVDVGSDLFGRLVLYTLVSASERVREREEGVR